MRYAAPFLLLLVACEGGLDPNRPQALVAESRDDHLLKRPFPHDELIGADGYIDLSGFPEAGTGLGASMVAGWAAQASLSARGFSALAPIYLRFDGEPDLPATLPGTADDPVRLVSLDSGHQPGLVLTYRDDPMGDPFFVTGMLIVQPAPWTPLKSGETYRLEVDETVAKPSPNWRAPDDAPGLAHHTTFTVQDTLGELRALNAATDDALDDDPTLLEPIGGLRRLKTLTYKDGLTPSGKAATLATVTFDDDSTEVSYMAVNSAPTDMTIDLYSGPMDVFQATIRTLAFQDLADQPYASPGLGLLTDFQRLYDGWIDFDADGQPPTPVPEDMRITIMVPRSGVNDPIVTWDHGTGGSAYNAVNRDVPADRSAEIRQIFANAGVVVVSRDQPLYGTRYPLIDEGFDGSLGFYNIGNLPTFRDNQRQAAVDHRVLHRFATEVLPGLFQEGRIDPTRVGAFGHSLGSVTAHLGLAAAHGEGASSAFMSGAGGYFTYYVTNTGLLGTGNDVVGLLGDLIGVELTADSSPADAVGALLGVPESAWPGVNDTHPVMGLFQLIMDPSDPLVVAPEQVRPETILLGEGDLQVFNGTTRWLGQALPDAEVIDCVPQSDYDGHQCLFREDVGLNALDAWVEGL